MSEILKMCQKCEYGNRNQTPSKQAEIKKVETCIGSNSPRVWYTITYTISQREGTISEGVSKY